MNGQSSKFGDSLRFMHKVNDWTSQVLKLFFTPVVVTTSKMASDKPCLLVLVPLYSLFQHYISVSLYY